MSFDFNLTKLADAPRLETRARATVQSNGRLSFTTGAINAMKLSKGARVLIFDDGEKDIVAVVSDAADMRGFELKASGPYLYLGFRNYLKERGIDFKYNTVIYDISAMPDQFEGHAAFRFERRDIIHKPEVTDGEA